MRRYITLIFTLLTTTTLFAQQPWAELSSSQQSSVLVSRRVNGAMRRVMGGDIAISQLDRATRNEILERVANAAVAHNIVNAIIRSPYTRMLDPHFHFGLIEQDPDDNKFVDCAIVASAKYIVTEDHHYDVLKRCSFPKVDVVDLDTFLCEVQQLSRYGVSSADSHLLNEPIVTYGQE